MASYASTRTLCVCAVFALWSLGARGRQVRVEARAWPHIIIFCASCVPLFLCFLPVVFFRVAGRSGLLVRFGCPFWEPHGSLWDPSGLPRPVCPGALRSLD